MPAKNAREFERVGVRDVSAGIRIVCRRGHLTAIQAISARENTYKRLPVLGSGAQMEGKRLGKRWGGRRCKFAVALG